MTHKQIQDSRVLVTGGAGFIGSNLCEVLLQQNNEVVCLDNLSTGYKENISEFLHHPKFEFIEGDIRNYSDCEKAVKGAIHVIHQAALGSVPRSIENPILTNEVNVCGFMNMLWAAHKEGVKRFVYASSSSVYGDSKELPKEEHQLGRPLSPYAISKLANELYARNFSDLYGIETIGLRYFNVFGKRQDPSGAYAAVIPKFILKLLNQESPVIYGDGSFSRDFTYIDNVIAAIQLAVTTPTEKMKERQNKFYTNGMDGSVSEVFNIACGARITINQLVNELIWNCLPFDSRIEGIKVLHAQSRNGDIPHSLANIKKAKKLIGYEPQYDTKQGLKQTCKWYAENHSRLLRRKNQAQISDC